MNWRPSWPREREPAPASREETAARAERTAAMVKRLRDTRVMRGLSLADVERDTRINRVYLQAIEDARFEELPAPVYARGFVRSYARYLGLDPVEAVESMPRDLPRPSGMQPMPGLRRTAAPALPSLPALPAAVNGPIAGALAAAVALVLLAVIVVPRLGGGSGVDLPEGTAEPTETTVTVPAGGTSTPDGTPDTGETNETPVAGSTVPPFEEGSTPDFTGVSRTDAQEALDGLGVTPLIVEAADSTPAGLVFDQSPDPGADLQPGDVVTLFVSQGP